MVLMNPYINLVDYPGGASNDIQQTTIAISLGFTVTLIAKIDL